MEAGAWGRTRQGGSRAAVLCLLASCEGPQSALAPAGEDAETIARLFWWMFGGGLVVWLGLLALAIYAVRLRPETNDPRQAAIWIIGGGVLVPTVVLAVLLAYGLSLLPGLVARAPTGSLQVFVSAEQWWWRFRYQPPAGQPFELANEVRIPVGQPVEFVLETPDVIHSFWVPSLGGKVDVIPGRQTHLALLPTRTGVFHGVCAEYCGTAHAQMGFRVVVLGQAEYDAWLESQRQPALAPSEPVALRGSQLFLAQGCAACHTVRGTPADGRMGPDLTHFGGRLTLGSAALPNDRAWVSRWLSHTAHVKPGVRMPSFGMLPSQDLEALTVYLEGLR